MRLPVWLWPLVLLPLLLLQDSHEEEAGTAYHRAHQLYYEGKQPACAQEAAAGYARFRSSEPKWAEKFLLLEANAMLARGMGRDALALLAHNSVPGFAAGASNEAVEKLMIESAALTEQQQFSAARERLERAEAFCSKADFPSCIGVLTARAGLADQLGKTEEAHQDYALAYTKAHSLRSPYLEANISEDMGYIEMQAGHFDEALDWERLSYQDAERLGNLQIAEIGEGNIGWAYYQLGDGERALEQFEAAQKMAARVGDVKAQLLWQVTSGYIYRDRGDLERAAQSFEASLKLARGIDSKESILNTLEDMAQLDVARGKLDEAQALIHEAMPMETAGGRKPTPEIVLVEGQLAGAQHEYAKAAGFYHAVLADSSSLMDMRLNARKELGELDEKQGQLSAAEQEYRKALAEWDAARAKLKEDSRISYGTNASHIYGNYVRLLVSEGRTNEALTVADGSRARTLEDGLDGSSSRPLTKLSMRMEALDPQSIARKANATLLFYWLGEKKSYLWAITPARTEFFRLPAQKEIAAHVESYNRAILDMRDPAAEGNADGQFLYQALVAPAKKLIGAGRPVIVFPDATLSRLNFETLPVPAAEKDAKPGADAAAKAHYLIEDATLVSAPSLDLLAHGEDGSAKARAAHGLLLMGNPTEADAEYPPLPLFGAEMQRVASHFPAAGTAIYNGGSATPTAYENAHPGNYEYIHFVSHATASEMDPLESAIILSRPREETAPSGYKLYAREIVTEPLAARLVTVSACYGSGTRAYAGEGLVGLAWAFLRAGARHVVAALWEVSDESTPRLMNSLYAGIAAGKAPAEALREAKLELLHSQGRYRLPFYWAAFEIYSRK